MLRVLTNRDAEFSGNVEHHDYQLYLAINDIDHTKTMSPQTNGICERFHKTILREFYQITFRKKFYSSLDKLQQSLDIWLEHYNNECALIKVKCAVAEQQWKHYLTGNVSGKRKI